MNYVKFKTVYFSLRTHKVIRPARIKKLRLAKLKQESAKALAYIEGLKEVNSHTKSINKTIDEKSESVSFDPAQLLSQALNTLSEVEVVEPASKQLIKPKRNFYYGAIDEDTELEE